MVLFVPPPINHPFPEPLTRLPSHVSCPPPCPPGCTSYPSPMTPPPRLCLCLCHHPFLPSSLHFDPTPIPPPFALLCMPHLCTLWGPRV